MFLSGIYKELESLQLGFQGKTTIDDLLNIDIESKEGRFKFILEVLRYGKSLGFTYFKESDRLFDKVLIKRYLIQCKSYSNNPQIVKGKLLTLIQDLSFEFIEGNNGDFDFSLIKGIISGDNDINEFVILDNGESSSNIVYSFEGIDGQIYSGKGIYSLSSLKEKDALNILRNYKTEDELILKRINYLLNTDKKEINKIFKSLRSACISLLIDILQQDENKGKLLTYIKETL